MPAAGRDWINYIGRSNGDLKENILDSGRRTTGVQKKRAGILLLPKR